MDSLTPSLPAENKKPQAWLTILVSALALVLLYFSLRGLDWSSFWDSLRRGRYLYLFVTLPIGCFNYFLRALRWRVLVEHENRLSPFSVLWANMIGYLGNLYLPARAGEFIRSAILGKETGSGTSFILATALTERILDALTLVVILAGGLLWQQGLPPLILKAIWVVGIGGIAGLLVVFLLPHQEELLVSLIRRIPLPITFLDGVQGQLA